MPYLSIRRDTQYVLIAALIAGIATLMHYRGIVWILAGTLTLASYRRVGQAFLFGAVASIPICIIWAMNYALTGTLMGNRAPSDIGVLQVLDDLRIVYGEWTMRGLVGYALTLAFMVLLYRVYGRQSRSHRVQPLLDGRRANVFNLRRVLDTLWRSLGIVVLALVLAGCQGYLTPDGGYAFDVHIRIAPPAVIPTLPMPIRTPTPTFAPTATVAPTDTPEPTPSAEFATSQPPLLGRVNTYKLNVRSAAGVDNPDIGDLFLGNVVFIIGQNEIGTWFQVKDEDGVLLGWVDARYIEVYRG